jgi:cytochrome c553
MSIKDKITSLIASHPRIVLAFAGVAVAVVASAALGLISPEHVMAPNGSCTSCHGNPR